MVSPRARRRRRWGAACVALGFGTATPAAAETFLSARGSPRCEAHAEALAARIEGAMLGELEPGLRVAVLLRDSPRGTAATLSLFRGNHELGLRQLAARSCEEALDVVVAVAALALSSAPEADSMKSGGAHDAINRRSLEPAPPERARPEPRRATAVITREPATPIDSGASGNHERRNAQGWLWLGTGADLVGSNGALVSLGAALRSGRGAWRAQLWYGLPAYAAEEEALPLRSVETRSDRGALALDYCDVGVARWLALCGGLELGVTRRFRAEALDGAAPSERRWLEAGLAAALGSRLTYRAARWQPGIELSTLLPVLEPADGRRVVLRAQAGVAVPF